MPAPEPRPLVGVGVFVRHGGKILLGKRRGSHGAGAWALPGGHLEYQEELAACVRREVLEETNLAVANIAFGTITNDIFRAEDRHYLTVYMVCDYAGGTLQTMEPHKCERWDWFGWDDLPRPLFLPLENLRKTTYSPFPP
jgi:8-oxo-dGTP diphosphatase